MGWRPTDVWLDPRELDWFEKPRPAAVAFAVEPPAFAVASAVALPVPVRQRPARPVAARRPVAHSRRRRLATRFFPTVVGIVGIAAGVPMFVLGRPAEPAPVTATPAPTVAVPRDPLPDVPRASVAAESARAAAAAKPAAGGSAERAADPYAAITWRDSRAVGVPHAGSLVDGVRLPRTGPDWVTWDPVLHRVPNRANRLYGTDRLVRVVLDVITAYRAANPGAPRVVIGDLSRRGGGEIDEHVSHENGLDVDVYYPRRDGALKPPRTAAQVDMRLAQDLLDRFRAAGASVIFVGFSTPFSGPRNLVVPYPAHDNHMHIRIARG